MARLVCIAGAQRSGTTALQRTLGVTGHFHNFGEVFHTEPPENSGAFLEYAKQKDLRIFDMVSESKAEGIARDYIWSLFDRANKKIPLIDVKLNSWHVVRPFWEYIHQQPVFMKVLKEFDAFFVCLFRRDLTEQILSEHIARRAKKWHELEQGDVPVFRVSIDVVTHQARMIVQSEQFVVGHLRRYNARMEIAYEDLYKDGIVDERLIKELEQHFKIDLAPSMTPVMKKNETEKRLVVENYADAEVAIREVTKSYERPI